MHIRYFRKFRWLKQEEKYLDDHPEIAQDIREAEEVNLLRSVCGYCSDFYGKKCPRDPILCGYHI